jgi:hypothetical protein
MLFNHKTTNTHAYLSGSIDRNIENVTSACFYKISILPRTTGYENCIKPFLPNFRTWPSFQFALQLYLENFRVCFPAYVVIERQFIMKI